MKTQSIKWISTFATSTVLILLTACGSGDKIIDDIVDSVDDKYSAHVNYVNNTDYSVDFFLKSTLYNESVYANRFNTVELNAHEMSSAIKHEWISGGKQSKFAAENAVNQSDRTSQKIDLIDKKNYWAVAWLNQDEPEIDVFQKSASDTSGVYKVRVFSSENAVVKNTYKDEIITSASQGEVSGSFALENCSDLSVANIAIDLCQQANLGNSYLVVVDVQRSQVTIVRE